MQFIRKEIREYSALLDKIPTLLFTVLVLCVVAMNLLANKELFRFQWVALDCGFVLSWIPFTIMDAVCRAYGGKAATRLSILAIIINLLLFGIFKLVALTDGMWGAYYDTGMIEVNSALNATIGGSSWIVIGSALAMSASTIVNSSINMLVASFTKKDNYKAFAVRSFTSTAIAQFTDNLVFALLVSIPLFGWNFIQALLCSIVAAIFELGMEVLASGAGFRISLKMREKEEKILER